VTVTETAAEARAALAATPFDAIVCDLILPDENSLHLLRDLIAHYPSMATIAISGGKVGAVDLLQLAQTVGVDAVVRKPLELMNFVATVERTLTAKQALHARKHVS
jgi:DNA-binding NtrC family response regulator